MDKAVISIKDLCFAYGDQEILHNISADIIENDFVTIVGQNGTGKSTLLKLIMGLLPLKKGSITVFGESINHPHKYENVAYVSQKVGNFNTDFPATVEEVVQSVLYNKKNIFSRVSKKDKQFALDNLTEVGMIDRKNSLIGRLSGGQQQRVFIARALTQRPKIMLLDEPTVGIDNKSVKDLCEFLGHLNKIHNITIVMVTHDFSSVEKYVNKKLTVSLDGSAKTESFQKE